MANTNPNRFLNLAPDTPADVAQALRYAFNALEDHNRAIKTLKGQQTAAATTAATTVVSNTNTVTGNGDVTGPSGATPGDFVQFADGTGKVIQDGGLSLTTDGTLAAASDLLIPSENAVKTYVDSKVLHFADNEVVAGSGTAWTLAHTPSPLGSLLLFVVATGLFLTQGTGYTIVGAAVTTIASYSAGGLVAFYRY